MNFLKFHKINFLKKMTIKIIISFLFVSLFFLSNTQEEFKGNSSDPFDIDPEDEKFIDQLLDREELKHLKNENLNLSTEELRQKQKEERDKILEENITNILNDMNLGNKTHITKDQFIILFKKLFNSGEKTNENEETLNKTEKEQSFQEAYAEIFIETILSKIIEDVPNIVDVKDISKFFNPEKFAEALQEMIGNTTDNINNDKKENKNKEKSDL